MTSALIVAGVCLFLEAFFSGSEIAVVSADRLKIREGRGISPRARRLLQMFLGTPQRLLATTLVGTQISVVTSTITLTLALEDRYGDFSELLVLVSLTPILVILGEIVPKSFAQQHADRLAPVVVYPLWVASLVFSPIVSVMVAFSARVSRRLGIETAPRKLVQREDLELIVKGASRGDISDGERRMISRIFDFGERTAYDMMVGLSSLTALREDMTVEEAVRAVAESGYTRYPVYRERVDRVVGMVHTFELLKAGRDTRTVGQLMRPPIFTPENQPGVELLMTLQRQRQGMAIVVDEYGGAVGVVTIEDILEEIVGEIDDEYDVAPAGLVREGEGVWRARAQVRIAEVNRVLKLDLPDGEDYESLAGLILDRLKHIPKSGESVLVAGVTLVVTAASQRAIEEVQIRLQRKR